MTNKDENVIFVGDVDYTVEEGGIGRALFDKMQQHGEAIAQVDDVTGEKDTYSAFLQRSVRTALKMRSMGIKRGDMITIMDSNHLNVSVPLFASQFLGAVASAVEPNSTPDEVIHVVKMIEPRLIFTSSRFEESISEAIAQAKSTTRIVIFGKSKFGNVEFEEFLTEPVDVKEERCFEPITIEDPQHATAFILFSSGSTGLPKGICLNHYAILYQAVEFREKIYPFEIVLNFASICWITKLFAVFMSALYGCTLIIVSQFKEDAAWSVIIRHQVNSLFVSPSQATALIKKEFPTETYPSSLKHFVIGGNRVSESLLVELRKKIPDAFVTQTWGMTDTSASLLCFSSSDTKTLPMSKLNQSVGKPSKGVRYKIVDVDTEENLGPNKPGEMRLKSRTMMNGYLKSDSSHVWDKEGYFKTGDMMYYDEDLCFYYVERIGEMFKCRSDYVYPNLIEEVLRKHPNVKKAVVVGVPHPQDGMHPAAMVSLKVPESKTTPDELKKHVKDVGGCYPLLGGVMVVEAIPENSSGKEKRRLIREKLRNA